MDFGQIKNKFLEVFGVTVLINQKYSHFFLFFSFFYECNAAWTAKSTKSKSLMYTVYQIKKTTTTMKTISFWRLGMPRFGTERWGCLRAGSPFWRLVSFPLRGGPNLEKVGLNKCKFVIKEMAIFWWSANFF